MISRNKDHSKKEQQKTLTNTRIYLEEQKNNETKSNNSQKVFNKFL